ncbi:hypothetical protein RO3G_08762 [Rhizopus delemar RA 99-880]|uniref:EF-hand domain-containing protein n=1 Tax=Rhizopus delemar (strain RA 99-880 / ATCC MYA-4621 / FGSC 9543 / NRRL 43880) TaxID=246409 RepID=I1C6H7_RHIO9|nr:hypothetical protein RO3G_08762 [Rhizopus delemar RA 99-880]|eukprot:EIE84057.1 hypothetical protein RO3G_08762 [Rhizopus delemar RA 99-880]
MSDAEINYFKKKFEALTHGHGLTAETLKEIYKVAQIQVSDEEIQAQQYQINAEEGVTKVFKLLDTDNDGQINGDDLKRGIALFGNNVSEEEIQEMLHSADIDGDELINYEEFLKIMTPSKVNGQTLF